MATLNSWCCGGGAEVAAVGGTPGPGATVCAMDRTSAGLCCFGRAGVGGVIERFSCSEMRKMRLALDPLLGGWSARRQEDLNLKDIRRKAAVPCLLPQRRDSLVFPRAREKDGRDECAAWLWDERGPEAS